MKRDIMKKTIYKVQMGFNGATTPMIANSFDNLEEAKKCYNFQASRKDCTFVNLVKVDCEVICGNICEDDFKTFRFVK